MINNYIYLLKSIEKFISKFELHPQCRYISSINYSQKSDYRGTYIKSIL